MARLPIDILDLIFGFLVSHRETLIACSQDPILSLIVERHFYYDLTIHIEVDDAATDSRFSFSPDHLSKAISENPRILTHVRILQVHVQASQDPQSKACEIVKTQLDKVAMILLMFPVLEAIILTGHRWWWSDAFQSSMRDRLQLPTISKVSLVGGQNFPFSLLGVCKRIKHLSLSGPFTSADHIRTSTLPQLESLSLSIPLIPTSLLSWIKLHVNNVQSLEFAFPSPQVLSELLSICSGSLKELEVDLRDDSQDLNYSNWTESVDDIELSGTALPHLQQLMLRTTICADNMQKSTLPSAVVVFQSFVSSFQRLVLDINVKITTLSDLKAIDLSPLTSLGALSVSRIDVYIHTGRFSPVLTKIELAPSFKKLEGVVKLLRKGILIIHWETTPGAAS